MQGVDSVPDQEDHQGGDDEEDDEDEDTHGVLLVNFDHLQHDNVPGLRSQRHNRLPEHVHDPDGVDVVRKHVLRVGQSASKLRFFFAKINIVSNTL